MKARFIPNWGVQLIPENAQEKNVIAHFEAEGIRVSSLSSGGDIVICSPKMADLKQLHLDREQQTLLAYALAVDPFFDITEETDFGKALKMLKYQLLKELVTPTKSVPSLPPMAHEPNTHVAENEKIFFPDTVNKLKRRVQNLESYQKKIHSDLVAEKNKLTTLAEKQENPLIKAAIADQIQTFQSLIKIFEPPTSHIYKKLEGS